VAPDGLDGFGPALTVSGWGLTTAGTKSRDLMEAPIRVVDPQACSQAYGTALPPNTVCGGDGVHDACTGESGGPLFSRSANGTAYQLGVVGFGKGCGDKKFPGVYTRVAHYAEWIRKTIDATCLPGQIAAGQC
jgi:trypsin